MGLLVFAHIHLLRTIAAEQHIAHSAISVPAQQFRMKKRTQLMSEGGAKPGRLYIDIV
jgi:hypothetical protein